MRRAAAQRFLGLRRERAEAHAGDGDRDLELDRLLGEARAEHDIGAAFLAIAFERIARDRGAEEQEIVEMRQLALGAGAADVIDAGGRGAADFRQRVVVEGRRLARHGAGCWGPWEPVLPGVGTHRADGCCHGLVARCPIPGTSPRDHELRHAEMDCVSTHRRDRC